MTTSGCRFLFTLRTMVSVEEINHWLYANGLTAPSVAQADLSRWPRRLSERGGVRITDSNADNELIELVYEAREAQSAEGRAREDVVHAGPSPSELDRSPTVEAIVMRERRGTTVRAPTAASCNTHLFVAGTPIAPSE
jgi:hypothetical protein